MKIDTPFYTYKHIGTIELISSLKIKKNKYMFFKCITQDHLISKILFIPQKYYPANKGIFSFIITVQDKGPIIEGIEHGHRKYKCKARKFENEPNINATIPKGTVLSLFEIINIKQPETGVKTCKD